MHFTNIGELNVTVTVTTYFFLTHIFQTLFFFSFSFDFTDKISQKAFLVGNGLENYSLPSLCLHFYCCAQTNATFHCCYKNTDQQTIATEQSRENYCTHLKNVCFDFKACIKCCWDN